jgi:excinuclease ABC subunit A
MPLRTQGKGYILVEMQLMADVFLRCETCNGRRFKEDILEVEYKRKDIAQVLNMTVENSLAFLQPALVKKLTALQKVELVSIGFGQLSSSCQWRRGTTC